MAYSTSPPDARLGPYRHRHSSLDRADVRAWWQRYPRCRRHRSRSAALGGHGAWTTRGPAAPIVRGASWESCRPRRVTRRTTRRSATRAAPGEAFSSGSHCGLRVEFGMYDSDRSLYREVNRAIKHLALRPSELGRRPTAVAAQHWLDVLPPRVTKLKPALSYPARAPVSV